LFTSARQLYDWFSAADNLDLLVTTMHT
jgi:hypothetical protein